MKSINQSLFVAVAALSLCLLASCNPNIQLNADEDAPKIAEHVLGMPTEQAANYLMQLGFVEDLMPTTANLYNPGRRFSKDPAILLTIASNGTDTVHQVSVWQKVSAQEEKSARNMYWKWSHFTAEVTLPKVETWSGSLADPDSINTPHRYMYYVDGTTAKYYKQELAEMYKRGEMTKDEYEQNLANYARNREQFWADYQSKGFNVRENYRNQGSEFPTKGIQLILMGPDDIRDIYPDDYTLYYYTADFVYYCL